MAHISVERRSMSLEQWAKVQFARIDTIIIEQQASTGPWHVRIGQYFPDGYEWNGDAQPIQNGDFWGRPDGTAMFTGTVTTPEAMAGQPVWLSMITGAEVLVYSDGTLLNGIDPNRSRVLLAESARPHQQYEIMMEAYVRSKPDDDRALTARHIRGSVQRFNIPTLVVLNEDALALHYDLDILYALAFGNAAPEELQQRLRYQIERLLRKFPLYDSDKETLKQAVPQLRAYIRKYCTSDSQTLGHRGKLACVAHSHLDLAYHWKVVQTVQKNARTCLIQLRLMDRYPEFSYAHTQSWTYEMLEQYYPDLFEQVKQRVAEGRWELVGGMYVEPDCNLPSAESFVRQVLYGKRYFSETFGVDVDNGWLPDVFGNSPVLPQILKSAGIPYFVSNKMSTWNDTNRFPHNNFRWRGLDGSEVYACVPPVHFISWLDPNDLFAHWDAFLDKEWCEESLHMYGYGDGGSGVTEEMLEYYKRLHHVPELPQLRLTSGKEYLHSAFDRPNEELPVWDGELYLEMHRGTFTTKGALKRENRQGEFLAQEVETLCTLAALKGMTYPLQAISTAWKKLLLNQFHDILPGSHTQPVFLEAMETYAKMREEFSCLKTEALDVLAPQTTPDDVCLINHFSDTRGGIARLEPVETLNAATALEDNDGNQYAIQEQTQPGTSQKRFVTSIPTVPGFSLTNLKRVAASADTSTTDDCHITPRQMENRFFRLEFDETGQIVALYDKRRSRDVLLEGTLANEWQLFEDKSGRYNAWDILPEYKSRRIEIPGWHAVEIVEQGPVSIALKLQRTFSQSTAEQIIRLYHEIPRIDFETWVDWQETERLLKVAFPVTVKSRIYTTDTSAGGFERENHRNTSWQEARFEVCTHKWVDLSEGLFGVALMNDCKYGCDVEDNVLRLSLLRAPIRPDRVSDKGQHRFTYSLFTHDGDWRRGGVVEAAYDVNAPLVALQGRRGTAFETTPAIRTDHPALKCFALKCAEDGTPDVILRVAELYGAHGTATLTVNFPFQQVVACDLLERPLTQQTPCAGKSVPLSFRPYQIQTLRFIRS